MGQVKTARFLLEVDGEVSGFPISRAEGVLTNHGEASAVVSIDFGRTPLEYKYVLSGGTAYLKGPTGGFKEQSPESAADLYDPSRFLSSEGLPSLLAKAREPQIEGSDKIGGVNTYRIKAKVPTTLLMGLTTLAPGQSEVESTLWIESESARLAKAEIPFRNKGHKDKTTLKLTFSRFDAPVDIKPPRK